MLQFAAFSSDIELPFYTSLASHKINHDKLDESARRLLGLYESRQCEDPSDSCRMQIRGNALTSDEVPVGFCRAEGIIKNVNTIEDYRKLDKTLLLNQAGRTVWEAILDGTIYSCPSLLASFSVICFADLKKYKFTYHFGFPALHSESPWKATSGSITRSQHESEGYRSDATPINLTSDEATVLVDSVQTWRYSVDARQYGFFLAKKIEIPWAHRAAHQTVSDSQDNSGDFNRLRPMTPSTPSQRLDFTWVVGSLSSYEEGFFKGVNRSDCFICFTDPSTYPAYPGWMLRNLLVLIHKRWKLREVQIICYREIQSKRHEARSLILHLELEQSEQTGSSEHLSSQSAGANLERLPRITGWERNTAGKMASKIANLGEYMDPQRLADQAVDLNLKLIKWRIAPTLDLERIKDARCLLLGAGTLGTYVARNLLGWGIRKITFVDNGSVSYSNPVRQPLFGFKDCLAGGAKKAIRAAEALSEIYPGVDSRGWDISVPMAGHPIMDEPTVKTDFETLRTLIDGHDVIFLLMDTRESRWLPTVMGKATGKIIMNAALGFDTFVVMRHGCKDKANPEKELGCYFCNDIVAPADSVTDRSLDQQCTVTRPGIAAIASALLVEILVSLLQHPLGSLAPAPSLDNDDEGQDHPLGIIPHQIRGFLSTFQNMVVSGKSYDCCSACSDKVVDTYTKEGWDFVKRALNENGYVEELSGLAEVQRLAEKAADDVEWDDHGDFENDGDGEMV